MGIAVNTEVKVVKKPWGQEGWLQLNDRYCFKHIVMRAGVRSSLQHHEKKHETNYIVSGKLVLEIQNEHGEMEIWHLGAGDLFTVPPPRIHRVNAVTEIIMLEVSTPEVDDVIRHEDDTHRGDGRIESEHTENK